jgi:23S rRNA (uracil1939-C5)-methyltransferase
VAVESDGPARDGRIMAQLARIATQERIARISLKGEVLIARAAPALAFAGIDISPPPGAFVQAVAEAETAMVAQVLAAVGKAHRAADLFCGVGAFTLPLARSVRVLSVDADQAAVAALAGGVRRAQGLKPVETLVRDLFREPLGAKEMEGLDAVVLDPPRAGARTQCEELARSKVPCIVYVSCNPATLARDARTLVDAGYAIEIVTPIDQFLWSSHVEAVAVFRRPRRAR